MAVSEDTRTGWHLDRKVPIGIILVLVGYGITGILFVTDIRKDVTVLQTLVDLHTSRIDKTQEDVRRRDAELTHRLEIIEGKIDRLIERTSTK